MMPVSSHGPEEAEPIIVEIDGIGELEFPDGTDPSVIQAKVKELTGGSDSDSPVSRMSDVMDAALRSKGVERTPDQRRMNNAMAEGLMGGGGVTAPLLNVAKPTAGIVQGLARRLYGGLLKPKQGLKDSFGGSKEIAATLLDERAPISAGGLQKVTQRLGDSRNTAMGMVRDAEAQGMQGVIAKDVLSEFKPVISELRKRVDIGQPSELGRVGQRGRAILSTTQRHAGDIPLTRAQALKETAQDASSGAYRAMERGTQKQLSADDMLDTAVARGLKGGIERKVPGVGAQNARTQKLIGGTRALEDAVEREANNNMIGGGRDWAAMLAGVAGTGAGGPVPGAAAAALMRLLATPSTGSRIAIAANEAGKRTAPEAAARQALMALLSERSQ